MKGPLQIIYAGPLVEGRTCLQRMRALQRLGHEISEIDTCPSKVKAAQERFLYRVRRRLFGPKDLAGANAAILRRVAEGRADILWLDKGLTIEAKTIERVKKARPECRVIGYSPDDMAGSHNQSRQFLEHLPLYDLFFTTKSFGVEELKGMGCRRVEFVGNTYDPATHQPRSVTDEDRKRLGGPVGFIGNWESERALSLFKLAMRGVPVRVWGNRWERCRFRHPNLRLENRPVWGEEYAKALCSFDVNLGLLSKLNRDLSTTRSIEIPACGAFLLAERTREHLELFEEGKEAAFFDGERELLEQLRHHLNHPEERSRIAAGGRERCLRGGYSNAQRLEQMLRKIEAIL